MGEWETMRIAVMGQQKPDFLPVVTKALELIQQYDQRRLKRLKTHVEWIFDQAHSGGGFSGSYLPGIKACRIDFEVNPAVGDHLVHAAAYAGVFVHEATHAAIDAREIGYTPQNRAQIERVCYSEQNRFLLKLNRERPGLGDGLVVNFDPVFYERSWAKAPLQTLITEIRRVLVKEVPKHPHAPNPATGLRFDSEDHRRGVGDPRR